MTTSIPLRSLLLKPLLMVMTVVIAASFYSQPAAAGFFNVIRTLGSRNTGTALEIETEVTIGEDTIPRTIHIPMIKPNLRKMISPHSLRQEFIVLAHQRRGAAYTAKKLLSLRKSYPDFDAFLIQNASLAKNLETLQMYAAENDQTIAAMEAMQKLDGGEDVPGALEQFRDKVASVTASDIEFPGLSAVLAKHSDLKAMLDPKLNPQVFQTPLSISEQATMMLYKMPIESLSFFIAQGAVYFIQLETYAGTNPLLLEQHLQSQKDPVTVFSFMALMLANGISGDLIMNRYGYKDWVRRSLPYLTLPIGIEASNITTDMLSHHKDSEACGKEMAAQNGQMGEKCQSVWKELTSMSLPQWVNDNTPGLLSMVAATAVSSAVDVGMRGGIKWVGERAVTEVAAKAAAKAGAAIFRKVTPRLIVAGLAHVGLAFATGGGSELAMDAGFFALSVWQNTQFLFFMNCLDYSVSSAWRNVTDSVNFASHDARLAGLLQGSAYKNSDRQKDLAEIVDFGKDMAIWRKANLGPIAGADSMWQIKLHDMMNGYVESHNMYADFLDKLGRQRTGGNHEALSIDYSSPMVGLMPGHGYDERFPQPIMFRDEAGAIEPFQKLKAREVGDKMMAWFPKGQKPVCGYTGDAPSYAECSKKQMAFDIALELRSGDVHKIGDALNKLLNISPMGDDLLAKVLASGANSYGMTTDFATPILQQLGFTPDTAKLQAAGSWARGQSFLFGWDLTLKQDLHNKDLERVKIAGLPTQPLTLGEYYMVSMAMGPSPADGGQFIQDSMGWKSKFIPPRLVPKGDIQFVKGAGVNPGLPGAPNHFYRPLFDTPVSYKGKTYPEGLMQILREQHIMVGTYNANDVQVFEKFWEKYVGQQYEKAWLDYQSKYQTIIRALIDGLYTPTKSEDTTYGLRWGKWNFASSIKSNTGPVGNGQITSMNQEFQMYLLLLDRILENKNAVPAIKPLGGYNVKQSLGVIDAVTNLMNPIIGAVVEHIEGSTEKMNINSILYPLRDSHAVAWKMSWEQELMQSYTDVEKFAAGLRVVKAQKADGHGFYVPLAFNSNGLDQRLKVLTDRIALYRNNSAKFLAKDPQDAQVADQLYTQMGTVVSELRTLILTANAISWQATDDGRAMPLSCGDLNKAKPGNGLNERNRLAAAKDECNQTTINWRAASTQNATGHNDSEGLLQGLNLNY